MMKRTFISFAAGCMAWAAVAENGGLSPQIANVFDRQYQSLDGVWKTMVDPFENGYYDYRLQPSTTGYFLDRPYADRTTLQEYDFDKGQTLLVPGDWNTQHERLYYYEGTVWYRRRFAFEPDGKRQFLYFGAVNYDAKVYLNGKLIGSHVGGFTPFNMEVTSALQKGENSLVVKVDNRRKADAVPTINTDWWNYGGITRQVMLVSVPRSFIRDYSLQLDKGSAKLIKGWVQLDGGQSGEVVTIRIPELNVETKVAVDDRGFAPVEIALKKVTLWEPENPKLYEVLLASGADQTTDRIGFRTIETRGTEILLNGKKIFCRGICLHEEMPFEGSRAYSEDHARVLLSWVKEMGGNFVRLAHYPHNEMMVRTAERMGIMVWSEIPVYWTIDWDNPDTYANAEGQLSDMVMRDKNRANVIIWSVANETPHSDARLKFLSRLIAKTRQMDNTRLVSAAMEKEEVKPGLMTVHDPLSEVVDLVSFNQYVGWYDGNWEKCDRVNWTFDIKKPVFISEFGGGARYNYHGKNTEYFTEEYLEKLYERSVEMFKRIPGLAGTTPWILKDFRSPRRPLPEIQDDFNRKGLISEKGEKKRAFYVMQKWYREMK